MQRKEVKNPQATVLKQLDSQKRYSFRERINIYIVAALAVAGLFLIFYTGLMAMIASTAEEPDVTRDIDINIDDVLDDLEDFFDDFNNGGEIPTQDDAGLDEDIDLDDNYENDEYAYNDDDDSDEEPAITGTINANRVRFVNSPGDRDALFFLNEGDSIRILDLDYNIYWAHIIVIVDLGDDPSVEIGFVYRHFIDLD